MTQSRADDTPAKRPALRRGAYPEQVPTMATLRLSGMQFEDDLEKEYWRDRTQAFLPVLRFSVALILFFYLTYLGLDWLLFQRFVGSGAYLLIWGVAAPAALLGTLFTYTGASTGAIRWVIFAATAINGVALVGTFILTRSHGSPYPYETLLIFVVYAYFLLGMSNRTAMGLSSLLVVAYLLGSLTMGQSLERLYDDAFMLVIIISVGSLASKIMERGDRNAWLGERRLRDQAEHDALTGLLNRREFTNRLQACIDRSRRSEKPFALCYLDIDGFKPVNDRHGHAVGDALLQSIADRLNETVRKTDFAARLGGDEFALILEPVTDLDAAVAFAQSVGAVLRAPYHLQDDLTVEIGASIGVALSADHIQVGAPREALIHAADTAMYTAKRNGKNRCVAA